MSEPVTTHPPVLVDATGLRAELAAPQPPTLLDVRWELGRSDGRDRYLAGHLPGAHYVDLDTELAAPAAAGEGRHPLPPIADLTAAARRWGLRNGTPIVVYDDHCALGAARAWWLLRWAGLTNVRILDGGLAAWTGAGGPLHTGAQPPPKAGDVTLTPGALPVLDTDAAAALPSRGALLDARAAERYRGEVEPIDPRAGHIPGAVSLPTSGNLTPDGRFLPAAALRARFGQLATAGQVGVYCGSGVTAAHAIAALAIAGIPAALYPGSWSQWSTDPQRPVATGAEPSGDTAPPPTTAGR
ncbi:sulfurtransferase [Micromonospora zingiberis]|uniref:Sulfurtransferase n=1 Tax=Micromonospora zingiberis TaxID=2053011 RepID=A0A4R0GMJ7_9ACTN|nr:sulfurtransferase [Micromonospora zingiberis]TCB96721.1 sulfurtransferase [Micromonospora zingiberis]